MFIIKILKKIIGMENNPKRLQRLNLKYQLNEIGLIVMRINSLSFFDYDMETYFTSNEFGPPPTRENVYETLKELGPEMPTIAKYPVFRQFVSTASLIPTAKQVYANPEYQKCWDIAYKWAMDYEYKNSNQFVVDAIKNINSDNHNKEISSEDNKKLEELETKIKNLERKLNEYENE